MSKLPLVLFVVGVVSLGIGIYLSYSNQHLQTLGVSTQQTHSYPRYPDPTLTPGNIDSSATPEEICQKGYTTRVRNVTVSTKRFVYQEYGLSYPQPKGAYEVDHFIPLELGGSNDITNLFPEPASPTPGYHEKDIVENYLHDQVCKGRMSLPAAQNAIREDWYQVYLHIPNPALYKWGGF